MERSCDEAQPICQLGVRGLPKHVIHKDQIVPTLLEACPSFGPAWTENLKEWGGESCGLYIDLGEFAHYIVKAYENGQWHDVTAAFDALEKLLVEGDSETQDYAALGIIETLQNVASHHWGADVFVPYLKPHSERVWNEINQGWKDLAERKRQRDQNSPEPKRKGS